MSTPQTPELEFYDSNLASFKRLLEEAQFILKDAIDFKIHSVPGRVKERDSVQTKILSREYTDPENEMTDLVGIRIISLFESDLAKAESAIHKAFKVITTENKIEEADDDTFGYMSIHYICVLRPEHNGPRYRDLHDIKFEVQSRTILMDAWANVSHYLAYKGKNSIPASKQRAFYALAGLFYLADQQFEQLLVGADQTPAATLAAPPEKEDERDLDRDRVRKLLQEIFPGRDKGYRDEEDHLSSVSEYVEEVAAGGLKTVGALRAALESGKAPALTYEADHPPNNRPGSKFTDVGIARAAAGIASPSYALVRGRHFSQLYAKYREDYKEFMGQG